MAGTPHSSSYCQLKIFILNYFPILKSFMHLPQANYHYLPNVFFKIMPYGYEIFLNLQPPLQNRMAKNI